jgi:hypothetical protein
MYQNHCALRENTDKGWCRGLCGKYLLQETAIAIGRIIYCSAVIITILSLQLITLDHGLITYIDTKAKCRNLRKMACKGTLWQVFQSL